MSQTKFHVNSEGEPGPCSAQVSCPFGSSEEHFNSKEEARGFYEKKNASTVLPQTLSKSELNRVVKDSTDPQTLLHGAVTGTDRTRGNLLKNPNATPESLVAVRDNSGDAKLNLAAQLHTNFPVEELDDVALDEVKRMVTARDDARTRADGNNIIRKIYRSDKLTDEMVDKVTDKFGSTVHLRAAVANPNNDLSTSKVIALAESDTNDPNSYLLKSAIDNNPKYPVADRISHLAPNVVSDLAGSVKDEDAIRNIVKYPADKSTRAAILYRVSINSNAPTDVLEAVAKENKSSEIGDLLYKHPNATAKLKRSLTDRSDRLRALGRIDELREKNPKVISDFESSAKEIPDANVSLHQIQFDPEARKRTGLTDQEVEVYAKNNIYPSGEYDPKTNIFTYTIESGGRWTGD